MWTVYLIHLSAPLTPTTNRHYLGKTKNLAKRIRSHLGEEPGARGSVFLKEANLRGIYWSVVLTKSDEDGTLERRWKNQKNLPRLCPVCRKEKLNGTSNTNTQSESTADSCQDDDTESETF